MTSFTSFFLLLFTLVFTTTQVSEPSLEVLRAKAQERMSQDRAIYSVQDLRALEELYQSANRNLSGPNAKEILQRVVKEYPKSNRAGSALLYLAQLSSGAERESYLKSAIDAHSDAWYGDGVQVGAFARVQLARFYAAEGKMPEARALAAEVVERFPGAVDHTGRRLVELLRSLKLQ
jgi:Tetratricopeptide repeat